MDSISQEHRLIDKLHKLPKEKLVEVEDFIDFLSQRWQDGQLTKLAMKASEVSFAAVWDNANDAEYDEL